jgi:hypothetical protein
VRGKSARANFNVLVLYLEVDGATVGTGSAGPFLVGVASGQNCSLVGCLTIQLVK